MDTLALICERIAARAGRLRKVSILAEYFRALSDADLEIAVRFLCCGPVAGFAASTTLFGKEEVRTLSVGWAVLRDAATAASGWDAETYHQCHEESGDTGETIALLIAGGTAGQDMTLELAQALYLQLYRTRVTAEKVRLLKSWFNTYRPLTVKYFVKIITGGLRIGLQAKMVEEAVASATGAALDDVRAANHRLGNMAAVALAARRGALHTIEARLFHPMEFMLAKPIETAAELADPEACIIEDKYDGIRSQVHYAAGHVEVYTRGLDEVTHAFPEIEAAFAGVPGSAVLDGEILAWAGGRAASFTVLQQRLARKRVTLEMRTAIPVAFMAYDILYRDGSMLVDRPIEERRAALLEALAGQPFPILISPQFTASTADEVDRLFEAARLRGNEGLVIKRRGSRYEPGRRSGSWYKLKRPYATLDVVITAAEQGHGKRATVLSDYTFAVRDGDRFVNIGKAYSGLTDVEIRELTRILRAAATQRFGRVLLVEPAVVLEVAFDGIQKSARHKSGFALRFPRIVRWRKDKTPLDCDSLERVRTLYASALNLTAKRIDEHPVIE